MKYTYKVYEKALDRLVDNVQLTGRERRDDASLLYELVDMSKSVEPIEDIISIAMNKGNVNGIRASIYFIQNMKKVKSDVTVEELIEGLTQLVNDMEGLKLNGEQ